MEVCTDPLAPEYFSAVGAGLVVAVYTGSILRGFLAGVAMYLLIVAVKHVMERSFKTASPTG